jgi:hypothetical protein
MADLPERDAALLLDMLLAARDARSFIKGLVCTAGVYQGRQRRSGTVQSLRREASRPSSARR